LKVSAKHTLPFSSDVKQSRRKKGKKQSKSHVSSPLLFCALSSNGSLHNLTPMALLHTHLSTQSAKETENINLQIPLPSFLAALVNGFQGYGGREPSGAFSVLHALSSAGRRASKAAGCEGKGGETRGGQASQAPALCIRETPTVR
jgi:hypothetical protein